MTFISIVLDYPPTMNTYWRHVGSKVLVSRSGRTYRERVAWRVRAAKIASANRSRDEEGLANADCWRYGALRATIVVHPPDGRRRDLDNVLKALLDACTHAGIWRDDYQIDALTVLRGERTEGGCVSLTVEPHVVDERNGERFSLGTNLGFQLNTDRKSQ